MAVQGGAEEDVYATLLLNDTYLPGALVLAHSLRDAGTPRKLAVLVTLDNVSAEVITELKAVFDYVIPVSRIRSSDPANLHLMNRADLHSTYTKIQLWKQTQFRKIVYIDSDVVAYRAPDELFDISDPFSAAPDIGWPDIFNTGVMVITPNLGDYYAMLAMAERNISFDGADQGLINMHFKNNYNRISFTYNVTPSSHYQYVPAYRHFKSGISMVHFIGPEKPWFKGRPATGVGGSGSGSDGTPHDELTGKWWNVYDKHYRVPAPSASLSGPNNKSNVVTATQPVPELVQYFTKGEYQPKASHVQTTGELHRGDHQHHQHHAQHEHEYHQQFHSQSASQHGAHEYHHHDDHSHHDHHDHQHHAQHESHDHHHHVEAQSGASAPQFEPSTASSSSHTHVGGTHAEAREEQVSEPHHGAHYPPQEEQKPPPFQPTMSSWDAQRDSPPSDSKPEAMNFPSIVYEMSQESAPFVAPERYPSPPKNMWYEIPKEPPAPPSAPPKPIFPWEESRSRSPPSRVFPDDAYRQHEHPVDDSETHTGASWSDSTPQPSTESSVVTDATTVEAKSEPNTPTTPTIHITPSDPWTSFTSTNAWDDVPEIGRYVDKIQKKHQRTRSLKSPGVLGLADLDEGPDVVAWRRRGSKLTDFPTEDERPSLPVTPAPIRRPKFWGGGPGIGFDDEDDQLLPAAEGVPRQTDWVCVHGNQWTPADCLCDLTNVLRYYKDPVAQLQKLARQQSEALLQRLGTGGRDSSDLPPRPQPFGSEELVSPTYVAQSAKVLSPQPVKGSTSTTALRNIESHLEETTPRTTSTERAPIPGITGIPKPSYSGPGAAFEKGENIPTEDTPTPRATVPQPPRATRFTDIAEPSYTGPGPAFEKDEFVPLEETSTK